MVGDTMKLCSKCKQLLSLDCFYKNKSRSDGLQKWCKSCCLIRDKLRKRPYVREIQNRYLEKRSARYHKTKDLEAKKELSKAHYVKNKEAYIVKAIARADRVKRTIFKEDFLKVVSIYKEARRLRTNGFDVEVDHIVPLNGKTVSGLHVSWNLQIIETSKNRAKSNKF